MTPNPENLRQEWTAKTERTRLLARPVRQALRARMGGMGQRALEELRARGGHQVNLESTGKTGQRDRRGSGGLSDLRDSRGNVGCQVGTPSLDTAEIRIRIRIRLD